MGSIPVAGIAIGVTEMRKLAKQFERVGSMKLLKSIRATRQLNITLRLPQAML
jgi:hypothetical protein